MKLPKIFYDALAFVDDLMQQLNVRYALVGSVAEYFYGCRRDVYGDIDLVADLNDTHLEPLCRMLNTTPEYILPSSCDHLWEYLDEELIEAYRARCICQADYICFSYTKGKRISEQETNMLAIQAFIAHQEAYRLDTIDRAQRCVVREEPRVVVSLPQLEDLVACALVYGKAYPIDEERLLRMIKKHRLSKRVLRERVDRYRDQLIELGIYTDGTLRYVKEGEKYRLVEGHPYYVP